MRTDKLNVGELIALLAVVVTIVTGVAVS